MTNVGKRRLVYLGTIVAILAMSGGYVAATVLVPVTVTQSASFFQGGNGGANGFSTPSLVVASTPAATSSCTSGTLTGATSAGTVTMILSSTSGGTVCTTGDFAEEFVVAFSATVTTQTSAFTITTQVGAGAVETNTESVTLGTGVSGAFTQTVDVFVDYGAINPPASGVTVLDLVIQ